jgi:nucleoside phosphorylase
LNIVVALSCEAKPLVDRLKLRKVNGESYPRFVGAYEGVPVDLVVSGIGSVAIAAAIGWLAAKTEADSTAWLNVGVAGHAEHEIGTIIRVVCSEVEGSQRRHYPPLVAKWRGLNSASLSSSLPNVDYPGGMAVDMEANTFFTVANGFSASECIQSLKVISDNPSSSIEELNASVISKLIAPHVDQILVFAANVIKLLPNKSPSMHLPEPVTTMRRTVSQGLQLQEVCRRLGAINADKELVDKRLVGLDSISQVIEALDKLARSHAPSLITQASELNRDV